MKPPILKYQGELVSPFITEVLMMNSRRSSTTVSIRLDDDQSKSALSKIPRHKRSLGCFCCCHVAGLSFLILNIALLSILFARSLIVQHSPSMSQTATKLLYGGHVNYIARMNSKPENRPMRTDYSSRCSFDCETENTNKNEEIIPPFPSNDWTFEDIARETRNGLETGGYYQSLNNCSLHSRQRIAIIVPYRNRENHLKALIWYLHHYLKKQSFVGAYAIYVIEQVGDALQSRFNRAMLLNIGYVEAQKRSAALGYPPWCCFAFHDVDRYPGPKSNVHHDYSCPQLDKFRQLSRKLDKHFGGVGIVNGQDFDKVNGFSNLYFSWGKEDDEMVNRALLSGFEILFDTPYENKTQVNELFHADHDHNEGNPENHFNERLLTSTRQRLPFDGINCLEYKVVATKEFLTHTLIQVDINEQDVFRRFFTMCAIPNAARRVASQLQLSLSEYQR